MEWDTGVRVERRGDETGVETETGAAAAAVRRRRDAPAASGRRLFDGRTPRRRPAGARRPQRPGAQTRQRQARRPVPGLRFFIIITFFLSFFLSFFLFVAFFSSFVSCY